MSTLKRLTPLQSRKVNALVKRECCNCDNGHCILLADGKEYVCPQLISYSLLCKWFRVTVLPGDKLLYTELYQNEDRKKCTECGAFFVSRSNNVKYCPDCRKRITNRQAAERMRKHLYLYRKRARWSTYRLPRPLFLVSKKDCELFLRFLKHHFLP